MENLSLSRAEEHLFRKLNTPIKIQDYINSLRMNVGGEDTLMSPRRVLKTKRAHCLEGALLAAAILWYHGEKPLLLDLKSTADDQDHVVALFKHAGCWGAISKTNHAVLRYRDPIYRSVRELAMSYFHEYFLNTNGKKTLISFSRPFSLKPYGKGWILSDVDLWKIGGDLDDSPHRPFVPKGIHLRPADRVERKAGKITEWKKS